MLTAERLAIGLRRARRLPCRRVLAEIGYRIRRAAVCAVWRVRDAWCCTYSRAASSGAGLQAYAPALDPQQVAQLVPDLAERCCRYLAQSFDLLGSGWRTVTHGAASNGFAGHRYPPCSIRTDAGGAWLAGQVSRPNLARARAVWSLLHPEYRAVDWHLDFRSGYRWSPLRWYRAVPYGHLPGVDVKIPWELARMQHLPQLALAFGCARAGLARFLAPERYRDAFRNQVLDFVATNPPRYGVNWCSTMDVAIRAANWLLAYDLFRAYGAEFDHDFEGVFVPSIREHGRHIARNLERSPWRNNHYLAHLTGLVFVAAYLPRTGETMRWWRISAVELTCEIPRQFLADGTHFEGATSYHALAAELVTYALAMLSAGCRRGGFPRVPSAHDGLPQSLRTALDRMAEFLWHVTQPNGRMVQIGDHDSGRLFRLQPIPRIRSDAGTRADSLAPVRDEEHLSAGPTVAGINGLLRRPDIARWCGGRWLDERLVAGLAGVPPRPLAEAVPAQTRAARTASDLRPGFSALAQRLRTDPALESSRVELAVPGASLLTGLRALAYSDFGAYVFRSDRLFLCLRAGFNRRNETGGHAHADELGLEVCIDGLAWIRDPGSYAYTPSPRQRNRYRASAAHFVPYVLDGEPELWSCGLFDLALDVRVRDIAVGPTGIGVDLVLAGNRLGQLVTIGSQTIVVETWIFEQSGAGRLRARCRPGHSGRYLFRGEVMRGSVPFSPGYGLQDAAEGQGA